MRCQIPPPSPRTNVLRGLIEGLPAPYPVLIQDAYRYARYASVRRRRAVHAEILGRLESAEMIAQGPFRGMKYLSAAFCSELIPKLVGTYGRELNAAIETICLAGCDRIIDIGAAEGYYAVGLALRNPQARIIGFELNASARFYFRKLARLNKALDRIEIRGLCDLDSLTSALDGAQKPAIVCDCEGAEDLLLDPDRVEALRRSFVLVETHDGLEVNGVPLEGITERLRERFSPTHDVEVIASTVRTESNLPSGTQLTPEQATEAMNEGRPWAQWMFMKPKAA